MLYFIRLSANMYTLLTVARYISLSLSLSYNVLKKVQDTLCLKIKEFVIRFKTYCSLISSILEMECVAGKVNCLVLICLIS